MLLGIKLSNLSRDQKNLKAQKKFLTNFAECLSSTTRQKKLCREPDQRTRQSFFFAECLLEALGNMDPLTSARRWHSAKT